MSEMNFGRRLVRCSAWLVSAYGPRRWWEPHQPPISVPSGFRPFPSMDAPQMVILVSQSLGWDVSAGASRAGCSEVARGHPVAARSPVALGS